MPTQVPCCDAERAARGVRENRAISTMWDIISYLLFMVLLAAAVVAAAFVVRSYLSGNSPTAGFFGPKPDPRLGVIEQSSVDGRRKLLLIRRDDVEHLIMTGGPVDVVIETNISARRPRGDVVESPAAVFSRPSRTFGQASGGQAASGE